MSGYHFNGYDEIRHQVENSPITIESLTRMKEYLLYELDKNKRILEKFLELGKDTTILEYDIKRIEYALSLRINRPTLPVEYVEKLKRNQELNNAKLNG